MYVLEYYKAIEQPVPTFTVNDRVVIKTRLRYGSNIVPGTVIKVMRVYMEVRYETGAVHPRVETFHKTTGMSNSSHDKLVVPEVEEFQRLLAEAKNKLDTYSVKLTSFKDNDPQLVFYLADALDDFYAPRKEPS